MKRVLPLLYVLLLVGCMEKKQATAKEAKGPDMEIETELLLDADRAFSRMSEEDGFKTAYMHMLDSNGVLLRPGYMPIAGADAVEFLSRVNDADYTMKWRPKGGALAKSLDMGYTFGTYTITPKNGDAVIAGTYINVWKKQADGNWRYVLNSGNEGVAE